MISGHVFIAASLDGFIAREDGDISWLLPAQRAGEDHGYEAFVADIDVIVMGRHTFESLRGVSPWPFQHPVVILSSCLHPEDLPDAPGADIRIMNDSPAEVMARLSAEGAKRVYVDGGRTVQAFLAAGLISDLVITRIPVIPGAGRPLFSLPGPAAELIHEGTRSFPSGLVQSRYRLSR